MKMVQGWRGGRFDLGVLAPVLLASKGDLTPSDPSLSASGIGVDDVGASGVLVPSVLSPFFLIGFFLSAVPFNFGLSFAVSGGGGVAVADF